MATNTPRSPGRSNNILDALQLGERPFGVSLLSLWTGFLGGIYLLVLLASLFLLQLAASLLQTFSSIGSTYGGGIPGYPTPTAPTPALLPLSVGTILLYLLYITLLSLSHIAIARGLFLLQQWAWWTLVAIEACSILVAFIGVVNTSNSLAFVATVYLPALTLIYLLAVPGVRRAFKVPF